MAILLGLLVAVRRPGARRNQAMKIEFLNETLTEAKLTKGWFRKRVAFVERRGTRDWWFKNGIPCPITFDAYLDRLRQRACFSVIALPKATVLPL